MRAFDNPDKDSDPPRTNNSLASTSVPHAGGRKVRRAWRVKAAPLLAVMVAVAAASLTACQPPHVDILVYGDSLTVNAKDANGLVAKGKTVAVRAWGGTALCDWVPRMPADSRDYHPKTVVIALAGNVATCVANDFRRHGADGATANYERALRAVRRAFPTDRKSVV